MCFKGGYCTSCSTISIIADAKDFGTSLQLCFPQESCLQLVELVAPWNRGIRTQKRHPQLRYEDILAAGVLYRLVTQTEV
jgi:hypothetical protein